MTSLLFLAFMLSINNNKANIYIFTYAFIWFVGTASFATCGCLFLFHVT